MEVIALFGLFVPLLLGVSLFVAVLIKYLMRRNSKAVSYLLIISIFALAATTIDFIIYVSGYGDQLDLLGNSGRGFMVIFISPAIAIISTTQKVPLGKILTLAYTVATAILCASSIIFMWFYMMIAGGY